MSDSASSVSAGAATDAVDGATEAAADVAAPPQVTPVDLAYARPSTAEAAADSARVTLVGNLRREEVFLDGQVNDPLRFREALSALFAVVGSDYRYVPKDRTAYSAFVRMRRESAALSVWQAEQAYFDWLVRNDPSAVLILDPVVTVHPDKLLFEVFSKDEGTYAALAIARSALAPAPASVDGAAAAAVTAVTATTFGTTNVDFSQALLDGIQHLRNYRRTRLTIGRQPFSPLAASQRDLHPYPQPGQPTAPAAVLEKKIRVPDSWLRGFLQVQSAATLPMDAFTVAPVDLYNLLRHLRLHADRKGKRRGLRVELVPGERPRLVLEPWEVVLQASGDAYKGRTPKVVRVWGRRRLMLLRRMLPFVETIEVHLAGSGLPGFWVFRAGEITLTLGLTGFTASNWSAAVSVDLLLPRKTQASGPLESIVTRLRETWFATANDLSAATGLKGAALLEALQLGCQQGKVMYDLAAGVYRLRPLTDAPLDLARLEYRNQRERTAHDLLVRRGAVRIVTENRIPGAGLELTGRVAVEEDKREYRPQMLLGEEGGVSRAECTCPFFRKQGLKNGPCPHLIALRLAYADQERRLAAGEERQGVTVETRTYSKRGRADPRVPGTPGGNDSEEVVQVSLQRNRLKVRRGPPGAAPADVRLQTLKFNTPEEARSAYFARIEQLDAAGYLDATGM